jgi:hypothetical protein
MIWTVFVLASVAAGWLLGRGDAAANLQAAVNAAPEPLLLCLLGAILGLVGRDRIRLRRAFPSPSFAYAGKFLFVACLAPAATFLLAPVDWPVSWLPVFAAGCGGGAALWVGNLPMRV